MQSAAGRGKKGLAAEGRDDWKQDSLQMLLWSKVTVSIFCCFTQHQCVQVKMLRTSLLDLHRSENKNHTAVPPASADIQDNSLNSSPHETGGRVLFVST